MSKIFLCFEINHASYGFFQVSVTTYHGKEVQRISFYEVCMCLYKASTYILTLVHTCMHMIIIHI